MSCNQPLYREEEKVCRDTFIQDAEGAGLSYYFYKGLDEAHSAQCIDNKTHTMYFDAPDGLGGTGRKTLTALEFSLTKDYDYLIKTNVSTYLNLGNIAKLAETLPGKDDTNIYGARYIINKFSKDVPFPRGFFVMYSRNLVSDIVRIGECLVGKENLPKTDDTLLALASLYAIQKERELNYMSCVKEVPAICEWSEEIHDEAEFKDALAIRCKDEAEGEHTGENMRRVHDILNGRILPGKKGYRRAKIFETKYGMLHYGDYLKFVRLAKEITERKGKGQG